MSHSSFFSFFLFFFFFLMTLTSCTPIPNDLINQTCKHCANQSMILDYTLCSTSLGAIPVSHSANLQGLALIAMELALENATTTVSTIEKLLNGTSSDEEEDGNDDGWLRECLEVYSDAAWSIVNSVGAFLSEDYEMTRVLMSGVMEAASTCQEGGFGEESSSPLTKQNYDLFQLCGIALCIVHASTPAIRLNSP